MFVIEGQGRINDLKEGLRLFMSRYWHASTALFMIATCTFNYHIAKDRSARVILMTADGSCMAEAIMVDLYAKLLQHKSAITTQRANYSCTLEGSVEASRLGVIAYHNFWLSQAFDAPQNGERFLLN